MPRATLKNQSRKNPARRRTASKAVRQEQLIRATIRSVASRGLSDTTIATVAREAGLSQGIINLHFRSKERLLVETLRFIADEYRETWKKALDGSLASPAEKLGELVAIDFRLPVCDRNKLAVWFAFWGESKSRPTYRRICAERDRAYRKEMVAVCEALIEEGDYHHLDAESVAAALSAMTAGLWLDLLTSPRSLSRESARQICMRYLASAFPGHFGPDGAMLPAGEDKTA